MQDGSFLLRTGTPMQFSGDDAAHVGDYLDNLLARERAASA
jgi:hypothetical protein